VAPENALACVGYFEEREDGVVMGEVIGVDGDEGYAGMGEGSVRLPSRFEEKVADNAVSRW